MPGKPPPDPADHADHAEDFARRYAQELDYLTGDRMAELGVPTELPIREGARRILRAMRPKERQR